MTPGSRSRLGIIGIGLMGAAIAERALGAGFEVHGFDINPARMARFRRLGGTGAASARDVATTCRRILFSLMTTGQVRRVIKQIERSLERGSVIIDTTTGDPEQMAAIGESLRRRGVHYLDAPIAGNSTEARAGGVLVLVGGSRNILRRSRDVLDCFARRVHHAGRCGDGARLKLVFNLVLGLNRAALAEALAFSNAIGIPPARALEIMKGSAAGSQVMETKGGKMLARDFSTQARLDQHLKDVRLILNAGRAAGAKLPLSNLHRKLLTSLVRSGFGELDNSAIIKAFE